MNNIVSVHSSRINIDEPVKTKMVNDEVVKGVVIRKNENGTLVEALGKELLVPPNVEIIEDVGEACTFKVEINREEGVRLRYEPTYAGKKSTTPGGQSYMKAWLKKQNLSSINGDTIRTISQMKQDEQLAFQRLIKDTKEQIDKIMDKAEDADIRKLLTKGMSPEKMTIKIFEHAISSEKANGTLHRETLRDVVDEELEKLAKKFGSKEEMRSIVNQLKKKNLPVTEANIMKIRGALNKFDAIKNLSEEGILNTLKNNISLTVDKIYESKYSGGQVARQENVYGQDGATQGQVTEETLRTLEPQIENMLKSKGIDSTDANMNIAKSFIRHDVDITTDHMKAYNELKHLSQNMDRDGVIDQSAQNILEDRAVGDIPLASGDDSVNQQKNRDIVATLPEMKEGHIRELMNSGKEIHLQNLQHAVRDTPETTVKVDGNVSDDRERSPNENQQLITAKRQLEEIRLKMTVESAHRLYKQDIHIDTAPLEKIVQGLRQLEEEGLGQNLIAVGANPTKELVNEMGVVLGAVEDLKQSGNHILGKVYTQEVPFTLSGLHEEASLDSMNRQQSAAMYEKLGTQPRGDLGDNIKHAFGQLESILKDLGIQPSAENIRAAKILAQSGVDITADAVKQVSLLDQKVANVLTRLHPTVVAQMLKDQVSPLNQTIDEVLQYMDDFQESNGEDLTDKIAKYIHAMDQEGSLTKQERESMVGIYRMLHTIAKSEGKAACFLAKNNMKLTLNNLMEAAKYIGRTGGKRQDINVSVDDDFGGLEELQYQGKSITQQIQEAFQKNNMSTTHGNIELAQEMQTIDLEITAEGLIDTKQMEYKIKELIDKATPNSLKKALHLENLMDMPIEKVLEQLEKGQEEMVMDTTRIREQLKVAKETSAKAVNFLEKLQLPINLKNLHTMGQLMQDNHILSKELKRVMDAADHNNEELSEELKGIIGDVIERISDGQDLEQAYSGLQEQIDQIQEGNRFHTTREESIEYMCTDIKRMLDMNQVMGERQKFYQIPIMLGNEVSQLNMYYINDNKQSDEPVKVLLSLDTKHLGKVNAYVTLDDDQVEMQLSSSIQDETTYIESFHKDLEKVLGDMGLNHVSITYGDQTVRTPIDVPQEQVTITQVKNNSGQFERRI